MVDLRDVRAALEHLDFGEHGLTRNELRDRLPDLPDVIYLHLPDSKRFTSARAVFDEVAASSQRAEGEFTPPDDNMPTDGAEADYGPAGYGESVLVAPSLVGDTTNTPVPGFDGNSLETEEEYSNG